MTTLASLNDALKPINMEVRGAEDGPVSQVEWSVRDGRSLYRFTDDMVRAAPSWPHEHCTAFVQYGCKPLFLI